MTDPVRVEVGTLFGQSTDGVFGLAEVTAPDGSRRKVRVEGANGYSDFTFFGGEAGKFSGQPLEKLPEKGGPATLVLQIDPRKAHEALAWALLPDAQRGQDSKKPVHQKDGNHYRPPISRQPAIIN